jgi:hypothetical protein
VLEAAGGQSSALVHTPPHRAHCIDLNDEALKAARPAFGIDVAKINARMKVTKGGNESWINAERG